jgi:uncharacterized RDD family membrane protein YckC
MTSFEHGIAYKPNLRKRIFATLFDYGLYLLAFWAYVFTFGTGDDQGVYRVQGFLALPVFIAWFLWFVVVEAVQGATPGHQIFDLKIIQLNGSGIGFRHALMRHLLDPIDILFYGVPAIIAIKCSEKHQRLGDMVAKTVVVSTSDD